MKKNNCNEFHCTFGAQIWSSIVGHWILKSFNKYFSWICHFSSTSRLPPSLILYCLSRLLSHVSFHIPLDFLFFRELSSFDSFSQYPPLPRQHAIEKKKKDEPIVQLENRETGYIIGVIGREAQRWCIYVFAKIKIINLINELNSAERILNFWLTVYWTICSLKINYCTSIWGCKLGKVFSEQLWYSIVMSKVFVLQRQKWKKNSQTTIRIQTTAPRKSSKLSLVGWARSTMW